MNTLKKHNPKCDIHLICTRALPGVAICLLVQNVLYFRTINTQTVGIYPLNWHKTARILVDTSIINNLVQFLLNQPRLFVAYHEKYWEKRRMMGRWEDLPGLLPMMTCIFSPWSKVKFVKPLFKYDQKLKQNSCLRGRVYLWKLHP